MALEEWGHTSIHLMTLAAQSIVRSFYGQRARDAYFVGGSTGGDQAMEEAEFFPRDYDGIVAESPGLDYSHLIISFIWNAVRVADHPANVIPNAALAVLNDAVLASCGGKGGLAKDPFLNDPPLCRFNPASVQCRAGRKVGCLTNEQVQTAEHIYAGPRNPRTGQGLYPGFAFGSEADARGPSGVVGWYDAAQTTGLATAFAQPLIARAVFHNPAWDWRRFDFSHDAGLVDRRLSPHIDATNPDLGAFRSRGGRLIMTSGWSDAFNAQTEPIEYYDSVVLKNGSLATTQRFFRLFMVPGQGHFFPAGPGPNVFDALTAVRAWVERGDAPTTILATKYVNDDPSRKVVMSRPLCPYPRIARYLGSGSTTQAHSFRCLEDSQSYARSLLQERRNLVADKRFGDTANRPN